MSFQPSHPNRFCISEEELPVSPQQTLALVVLAHHPDLFESSADDFCPFSTIWECQAPIT